MTAAQPRVLPPESDVGPDVGSDLVDGEHGVGWLVGDGTRIARLVRRGPDNPSDDTWFGVELRVPDVEHELARRGAAYAVYRALRRSCVCVLGGRSWIICGCRSGPGAART